MYYEPDLLGEDVNCTGNLVQNNHMFFRLTCQRQGETKQSQKLSNYFATIFSKVLLKAETFQGGRKSWLERL